MVQIAAVLFVVASVGVVAFQLALLFGAPWGELTLGGKWRGTLPPVVRIFPFFSIVILVLFSAVILARAGLAFPRLEDESRSLAWNVPVFFAIGCIANAITKSRRERRLWLPVVVLLLALSLFVAAS